MKLFVRIMRVLTTALVVVIVLTAVGLLVIPRLANWTVLVVLSGSMEPVMPTGGLALVEPVDAAAIKVGDVVTFPIPGHTGALVSHRVTAIELDAGIPVLLTKGDANETPDAWRIAASSVSGKVAVTVPYLGHAAQLLRTPGGFLLALLVPAVVIILGELGTITRELRKMRQKSTDA